MVESISIPSEVLISVIAGAVGALIATSLRTYVDSIRWKIENVYSPLYGELSKYSDESLPYDLTYDSKALSAEGYFMSLWIGFDRTKIAFVDKTIRNRIDKIDEKTSELDRFRRHLEDRIVEEVIENDGGGFPKRMVNSNESHNSVSFVYTWDSDENPDKYAGIQDWMSTYGPNLIFAENPSDLKDSLLSEGRADAMNSYKARWRFKQWDQECYEALFSIVEELDEEWEWPDGEDDRLDVYKGIMQELEETKSEVARRSRVIHNIPPLKWI